MNDINSFMRIGEPAVSEQGEGMDAATLEALKGSIAKWEGIVAGTSIDRGENNCPLCAKFNDCVDAKFAPDCAGCPVSRRAGASYCRNTPYAAYAKMNWAYPKASAAVMNGLAQAELDFLRSLLPVTP